MFELDPTQWTAIGTIALAVVTTVLVGVTAKYVRVTKRLAQSSEAMPILSGHRARMDGGHAKMDLFGRGFAFQVVAMLRQEGKEGESGLIAVVNPETDQDLDIQHGMVVDPNKPYEVEISYQDALGHGYRTIRNSLERRESMFRLEEWNAREGTWESVVPGNDPR